jgi:hypothetical protein
MKHSGTITLSLEDFEDMKTKRVEAENEAARLTNALAEAQRSSGNPEMTRALSELVSQAIVVVRFAVAQLPPETTPNWPEKALEQIAALMPMRPGYGSDDQDLATELRAFARECRGYDLERRARQP